MVEAPDWKIANMKLDISKQLKLELFLSNKLAVVVLVESTNF